MGRRSLLSLLCLSAALMFVQFSAANTGLRVNERATKFLVEDQLVVVLEVYSPATQKLPVHLKLELLDPQDSTRGLATRDVALQPGINKLTVPLLLSSQRPAPVDDDALLWYRLRYRIDPSPEAVKPPDAAGGIISLSEVDAPDIFALEVNGPRQIQPGARLYTHIRARHPLNSTPKRDVAVSVELKIDDDDDAPAIVKGSGVTDDKGFLLISLNIPAKLSGDEVELKVVARHGGFVKETSDDIDVYESAQMMVTTDKPIYQPGQVLHARTLIFNSAKRAAANLAATLKISDPEDITVFQTELLTSRFGVASADWQIPENTRLGDYLISVELDDENYDDIRSSQLVKISRYDLPNFTVNVKPDHAYYLPQQNAEIEVRAEYLFGQPVKRGHVRVVREDERRWNFREQKWELTAGDQQEGETDDEGRFLVHLDLKKDHDNLTESDYLRFVDLPYAAYFTDPTTNRTEQRRFDLRVTKDAIHIYVVSNRDAQAPGFPLSFYLATAYADGTLAPCEVDISELPAGDKSGPPARVLKTIHTNKYGVAKVAELKLPKADVTSDRHRYLNFTARNNNGYAGHHTESFYYSDTSVVRVETDKALYRPGESIRVDISASQPEMDLIVDVARDSNIVESRAVALHGGVATFTLRYRPEFRDEVTISAYSKAADPYSYQTGFGSRTVLFPRDRDLKVNLRLDHADYKPGEDATVDFRILTPGGRPATSALGVVVFDRAVEERARTDQEFGGQFGFAQYFSQWRGYNDQVAGITRGDLQRIDLAKPLPEGLDLVAELLLGSGSLPSWFFSTASFDTNHKLAFGNLTGLQVKPIAELLEAQYKTNSNYPANGEALRRLLFESGINFDQIKDPWGTPYRDVFSIEKDENVFEVVSAGPDKVFATGDDFPLTRLTRAYFRFTGEAISRAVARFHVRTGGFIRDAATLKTELRSEGIDFDSLSDPWGQPYILSFTIARDKFNVTVQSSGADKRFTEPASNSDDFILWMTSIDYLNETRARMEQALDQYFEATRTIPSDDRQLQAAFAASAIEPEKLIDPWGQRFYGVYKTEVRQTERSVIQSFASYGKPATQRVETTPVTQQVASVRLRSSGADSKAETLDDFDVAFFSQLTGEQSHYELTKVRAVTQTLFSGAKGAINGSVTDANGAAIVGAKVKATLMTTLQEFEAETDDSGKFILRNLPVGFYNLRCDAANFKSFVISEVSVSSSNLTTIDFSLQVGAVTETVEVTVAASVNLDMTTTSQTTAAAKGVSIKQQMQLSTPRLREYFPETLVWQPSLETDSRGQAQLKFKLADNITTWKMSVIGSTEDGEIGMAETEIKAFQPFFVEHDPPRVLTEGDQISLPVVLRNYLERAQTVDLEMKPESWFTLLRPGRQRADVPAGEAARETFELKAVASVEDGKQRVTAGSAEANDAIEKPVTVHPDGEEKTQTTSNMFGAAATLNVSLPDSIIPGSLQAELKVYPNLTAHVVESMEGILERPHGCGEQTISSTYPSLLFLRRNKQLAPDGRINSKAHRYAEEGYQRLLGYRAENGGFNYWGDGDADVALTAYALRFLHDAAEFVSVDDAVVQDARRWLIKQQGADGSWLSGYDSASVEDRHRTALLTAFVTRVLALTEARPETDAAAAKVQANKPQSSPNISPALQRALSYLAPKIDEIGEPYLIASYALAAMNAHDWPGAARAIAKLRALAQNEGDASFWALGTNTPFHSWGLAGRVETTALAIQALARYARGPSSQASAGSPAIDPLVSRGLLFLLKLKDRYGVWHSTQATINVLDALMTLQGKDAPSEAGVPVEVVINGQIATTFKLLDSNKTVSLIPTDVSRFLHTGTNRIELQGAGSLAFASVQLVANYYVPWPEATDTQASELNNIARTALRLSAKFGKNNAKVQEEITCHVKAARINSPGSGMMLAEIGLPPGAEVDRASLESARKNPGWAISHYDVLPDRVVFYLWPHTAGLDFDFKFRPRFAMTAKAAPSVIYDYYNPEARAVVAPVTFVVK